MSEMVTSKCPQCGAEMPGGTPGRVCLRCAAAFLKAAPTEMPGGAGGSTRPFTPPAVAELAPLFPQLEIIELIGQGGMGAVYKVRQKELDRIVALKILPPGFGDAAFAERFAREAKALARLNHPGIVTLYEFGRSDGLFFFLMEFVDGATLRQVLHGGRISPREALAIVPGICDALQYAHDQGIVHRDIKPENILLDRRGRTKVADFGLAKLMESGGGVSDSQASAPAAPSLTTQASKVLGTPQYMAPEQVDHPAEVDHRADIYALGVVFYQMLTGELPGRRIEPPSKKVHIDVRLDEVVLRALENKPELRYQQASEVKTAVETIASTPRVSNESAPKPDKGALNMMTWLRTKTVSLAGVVILLAAVILIFLANRFHSARLAEDAAFAEAQLARLAVSPDIQGAWEGVMYLDEPGVAEGEQSLAHVVLKLTKTTNGYSATTDWIEQGRKDVPMGRVVYKYPSLQIERNPRNTWKLTVDANAALMALDYYRHFIIPDPVTFKRTTAPDAVSERLAPDDFAPRNGSALQGYWKGEIGAGPEATPVDFKIAEAADGAFRAEYDSPMLGANRQPAKVIDNRPAVKLTLYSGAGMFQGEINSAGTEIIGSWMQGGAWLPAALKRADFKAEHAQDAAKDYFFTSGSDLQGHWKGSWGANQLLRARFAWSVVREGGAPRRPELFWGRRGGPGGAPPSPPKAPSCWMFFAAAQKRLNCFAGINVYTW
jgi:tRNA A-37 threonylcarbamoyl transferase component Bud32